MVSTLSGASIILKINGQAYNSVKSIRLTIDYGEDSIYGIDSTLPQEIRQTRFAMQGIVTGIKLHSDTLQQRTIIRTLKNSLQAQYISIQILDRITSEMIYFIQQAKVTTESFSVSAKGVAEISFNFKGIKVYQSGEMNYT
jgi:hypothetical protein